MGVSEIGWCDLICFGIVGVAFVGALLVICWRSQRKTTTCVVGIGGNNVFMNMYESLRINNVVGYCRQAPPPPAADDHDQSSTCTLLISRIEEDYYWCSSQLWMSCWGRRRLSPAWLLSIRFLLFAVLCVVLALDVLYSGPSVFVFYTEWTFTLVIIYFGMATIVSVRGCLRYYLKKPICAGVERDTSIDIVGNLMQVVYQTCGGAVVITDIIFWCVIVPFLPDVHLRLNLLMVCMHTLNAITLLIDTSINTLPFAWFGLAYFVLWSCCYVIVQWLVHAFGFTTWWPYPFLAPSTPWAPLWYFCLAVIHIPCYGFYWLLVHVKNSIIFNNSPNIL